MPSYFALSVQGMLYPEQKGGRRRLKGELEMSFSFVLPPVLALVPENVLRGVAESVRTTQTLHAIRMSSENSEIFLF